MTQSLSWWRWAEEVVKPAVQASLRRLQPKHDNASLTDQESDLSQSFFTASTVLNNDEDTKHSWESLWLWSALSVSEAGRGDVSSFQWGSQDCCNLEHEREKELALHAAEQTLRCRHNSDHLVADQSEAEFDSALQRLTSELQDLADKRREEEIDDELLTDADVDRADNQCDLSQISQPPEDWQHPEPHDLQQESSDSDCIQLSPQAAADSESTQSALSVSLSHDNLITSDDQTLWTDTAIIVIFHCLLLHLLWRSGLHCSDWWWHWSSAVHHQLSSLNSARAVLLCGGVRGAHHHLHHHTTQDHSSDEAAEMLMLLLEVRQQCWEDDHTCCISHRNAVSDDGDHQHLQTQN